MHSPKKSPNFGEIYERLPPLLLLIGSSTLYFTADTLGRPCKFTPYAFHSFQTILLIHKPPNLLICQNFLFSSLRFFFCQFSRIQVTFFLRNSAQTNLSYSSYSISVFIWKYQDVPYLSSLFSFSLHFSHIP